MTTLNLPQVKSYESKGRWYHYHRPTGERIRHAGTRTAIDPEREPEAFLDRVRELDRQAEAAAVVASDAQSKISTLGDLVKAWRASDEWKALAPDTRKSYERVVDPKKGSVHRIHGIMVDSITPPFIVQARDKVAKKNGRWLANYTVTVLRAMFTWGKLRGSPKGPNPAEDVPPIPRPDDAPEVNRNWAEAEFAAMLGRALAKRWVGVAKALALGRWAGMRVGDIATVKPAVWDGRVLKWLPKKSRRKKRVVTVRAIRELREILAIEPAGKGAPALVLNMSGDAYTVDGLQTMVWKLAHDLEKEGAVQPGLSMHGLRHSLGSDLYDLELERSTRKAALGHDSDAASQVYERGGDRGKLADKAFAKLERSRARRRKTNGNGT